MLWDNVADYVKATEDGRVKRPKSKSYEVVKECPKDPCFVAKLHFFKIKSTAAISCKVSNK